MRHRAKAPIRSSSRRARLLAAAAATALLSVAAAAAAEPPAISSKRADAERVLGQIQQLDSRLSKAIESWDAATTRLRAMERSLRVNRHELGVARTNLGAAQRTLSRRLVQLYVADEQTSTLSVLLGSSSFDELMARIDTVGRVSDQDARVVREVLAFRHGVVEQRRALAAARRRQREVVAERADRRRWIEGQLAERQQLLSSIKDEIARMQEEERRRQAVLARRAQARLAAQEQARQRAVADTVVGVTAAAPEGVAVPPPSRYGGVVGTAMQYLGTPYLWGGASPGGFDCSGFIMYVYAQHGVALPHNAAAQFGIGTPVERSQLEPGDLVFFDGLGHNGIYIGGGQFIHSPHTGDVVKISSLDESWYASTYVGARRIG